MRQLLLLGFWMCFSNGFSQTITIMIDPGHGGSDPGHLSASKKHLAEKDLNLIIARKLGKYLEEKLNHVQVQYTRTNDTYPSLDERVELANSGGVDYFISIHCNGSDDTGIRGTESHVHALTATKSVRLAKEIETEFTDRAGRKSRGVKDSDDREHSIQVLKYTKMTSVLVECGFLTNTKEAAFLNSTYGQDILASAMFRAIRRYLQAEHKNIAFTGSTKNSTGETKSGTKAKYSVQIMSSKEEIPTTDRAFKRLSKAVRREKVAQTGYRYRYLTGEFATKEEAEKYLAEVRKNGFRDAMLVRTD